MIIIFFRLTTLIIVGRHMYKSNVVYLKDRIMALVKYSNIIQKLVKGVVTSCIKQVAGKVVTWEKWPR